MGETRERRKERVSDGNAVRATAARRLHPFHGVAQSAAEGNRDHDVLRRDIPRQVNDLSARCRRERIQAKQDQMVFEVFGEHRSEIASQYDDAPRFIKMFRGVREPFGVEGVLEGLQILAIEFERIRDVARDAGRWPGALHRVRRRRKSQRKLVQVVLELTEALEAKAANDANYRGWVCAKPLRHAPHIRQNKGARMLENRSNDFLSLRTDAIEAFRNLLGVGGVAGGSALHELGAAPKRIGNTTRPSQPREVVPDECTF